MGLYVQSLTNIPTNHHRDYFIYLLDYGWKEPLGDALMANYEKMAEIAAENKAVVIRGTKRVHFEDEVFSWHHINGEDAEELLPAILITNRHPKDFKEWNESRGKENYASLKYILVPLKLFCKTTTDVVTLVEKIFNDIIKKKDLKDFKIIKEDLKGNYGSKSDALILGPNENEEDFINYNLIINFLEKDKIIEDLKRKMKDLKPQTKKIINDGIEEFNSAHYVSCARILYPSIEEIANYMIMDKSENPEDRKKFKGLSDKIEFLGKVGTLDEDLINSFKISIERNKILHGNYNPKDENLARPLCYSSMTFLAGMLP